MKLTSIIRLMAILKWKTIIPVNHYIHTTRCLNILVIYPYMYNFSSLTVCRNNERANSITIIIKKKCNCYQHRRVSIRTFSSSESCKLIKTTLDRNSAAIRYLFCSIRTCTALMLASVSTTPALRYCRMENIMRTLAITTKPLHINLWLMKPFLTIYLKYVCKTLPLSLILHSKSP